MLELAIATAAVMIVIAFLAGMCVGQSAAYRHAEELRTKYKS